MADRKTIHMENGIRKAIADLDTAENGEGYQVNLPAIVQDLRKLLCCEHKGYSFTQHGRCCPTCGDFLVDFGD